ncbi:TPA: hypothetical protein U1032_000585 [Streptococcus suis]|nr:hypothetical protein [Streptococcus suis]HEM4717854.1 hypothetical protein [Streptococcus suis]HEM4776736.1 hypothetical protein [Streptococcus suis]HEM4794677.1 hypothetical protein [Streptococcus suis]HEM4895053.1 hypothetical protein [Streptococcus suis]
MRLAVRLAIETRNSIEVLKKEIGATGEFDNLRLTNGFVVNQAYLDCRKITDENNWDKVLESGSQVEERYAPKTRTDLQVNQTTIDGIAELKKILPQYTETSYVTTSFVIRMIVRGSLLVRHGKI